MTARPVGRTRDFRPPRCWTRFFAIRDAMTQPQQQLAALQAAGSETLRLVPANVFVADILRAAEQSAKSEPATAVRQSARRSGPVAGLAQLRATCGSSTAGGVSRANSRR